MDRATLIAPWVTDPRDRAWMAQVPLLPVPLHGALPDLELNRYRLLAASSGLYIEARSPVLHVILPLNDCALPYGDLESAVWLPHGPVPAAIGKDLMRLAMRAQRTEMSALVIWETETRTYRVVSPTVHSASGGHVTYDTTQYTDQVLIDVHSHGAGEAFFSAKDDSGRDLDGLHYSVVYGQCDQPNPTWAGRLCVFGRFFSIDTPPWEDNDA